MPERRHIAPQMLLSNYQYQVYKNYPFEPEQSRLKNFFLGKPFVAVQYFYTFDAQIMFFLPFQHHTFNNLTQMTRVSLRSKPQIPF